MKKKRGESGSSSEEDYVPKRKPAQPTQASRERPAMRLYKRPRPPPRIGKFCNFQPCKDGGTGIGSGEEWILGFAARSGCGWQLVCAASVAPRAWGLGSGERKAESTRRKGGRCRLG